MGIAVPLRLLAAAQLLQYATSFRATSTSVNRNVVLVAAEPTGAAEWISLTEDDAVRKRILRASTNEIAVAHGSKVEIEYEGTIAALQWSAQDVVDCWLKEQQGLDSFANALIEHDVTGEKLMDEEFFSEDFLQDKLGMLNRIQVKKLVMASRRLAKDGREFAEGTVFDSSSARGKPFAFTVGSGKAIQALDLAVQQMKDQERAEIVARADYCYGKDGLRTFKGDTLIPPFATLRFEIEVTSC